MTFLLRSVLCFLALVPAAFGFTNWRTQWHRATTENLWSIAYGNDALIAVGDNGTILYSDYNGAPWQTRVAGTDAWLVGIGFGNNRWIAVGDRGTILVSDNNGDSWEARTSNTTVRLNAVAFGNGRWIAVGEQGTVLTSADGNSWVTRPTLGSGFLRALAFGEGQFLIGGAGGLLVRTTDATTFTPVAIATTADIEAAVITPGKYFVSGSNGLLASATQLGTWEFAATTPAAGTLRGLAARAADDATAVGDMSMWENRGSGWFSRGKSLFLATAAIAARDEFVAVGFGGEVMRSSWLMDISVDVGEVGIRSPNALYNTPVVFRVSTTGAATNLSYQWLFNNNPIPGATQPELHLPPVRPRDTGNYSVRVTTPAGSNSTRGLSLTVVPLGRPEIIDPTFNHYLPSPSDPLLVLPDGKLVMGGLFFSEIEGGPLSRRIFRLNRDGSDDPSFVGGLTWDIYDTITLPKALSDGRIYVGIWNRLTGSNQLLRLLPNGAVDSSFTPTTGFSSGPVVLTDGRMYVTTGAGTSSPVTVRLLADGTRDSTFAAASGGQVLAVDRAGRVLTIRNNSVVSTLFASIWDAVIRRFLPDGTPDPTFGLSLRNGADVTLIGDTFYSSQHSTNSFGGTVAYIKTGIDGIRDTTYSPTGTAEDGLRQNRAGFYRPDGGLWDMQMGYRGWNVRSYSPTGAFEPDRYATMRDNTDYLPLAFDTDGSFYAHANRSIASYGVPTRGLVRIRPIVGRPGRLTNLSVRAYVTSPAEPLIAGFVTSGSDSTQALVRAIGPSLAPFGVTDAMPDPRLTLTRETIPVATDENWNSSLAPRFTAVGAFPLAGGSLDAALEYPITSGNYTAVVTPAGSAGTALIELYESATAAPRRFINVSARGPVTATRPLIVGFTISGDVPATVLIRGSGPALKEYGVTDTLADPQLTLYQGSSAYWENDNWSEAAADATAVTEAGGAVGAFPFATNGKDAAMLVTLAPGSYTAVVGDVTNTSGTALIEVYEVR